MSNRSSSSKGRIDLEAMLDDSDDLDYEPEVEQEEGEQDCQVQVPEPSGQEFQDSCSNHTRDNMNYTNLHVDIDKDSCRSKFGSYSKTGNSYYLDSSEEEEEEENVEAVFSEAEYDQSEFEVSGTDLGVEGEPYNNIYEPLIDPSYVGPESPTGSESRLYFEDRYESDSSNYEDRIAPQDLITSPNSYSSSSNIDVIRTKPDANKSPDNLNQNFKDLRKNIPSSPNPRRKSSLNFKVQVIGGSRVCINMPIKKPKQKPWRTSMKCFLNDIITLSSTNDVIRFCPDLEGRISTRTPSLLSSESLSETASRESVFKVPLKRPPTRQKSIKSLSVCVDQSGTMTVKESEDNSDIISLIASTNIEDEDTPIKSEPLTSMGSMAGIENVKMNRVAEWVKNLKENKVPDIFKGLCYNHFFYDNCRKNPCKNSHVLKTHLRIGRITKVSDEELNEAYHFANLNPFFYEQMYKVFAETFGSRGNKMKLIDMTHTIFDDINTINKVDGLKTVLLSLQKTDLVSFEDTVDYFLLEVGLRSYPTLGEVILEIIISMNNLSCHWSILRRLFIAGEKVPLNLASRFLVNLMRDPVDHKICQEVYLHILKYKCLDLPLVPVDIREPFLKLCTLGDNRDNQRSPDKELEASIERNLSRERDSFERGKETDVSSDQDSSSTESIPTIQNDFSVPPPNFSAFGTVERTSYREPPTVRNSIVRPSQSLNFIPPTDFGTNSKTLDASIFSNNSVTNFTYPHPPPTFTRTIGERHNSLKSSESDDLTPRSRCSDTDSTGDQNAMYFNPAPSTSRPVNMGYSTGLTYNREGLQYDPANDYIPPRKRPLMDNSLLVDRTEAGQSDGLNQDNITLPSRVHQRETIKTLVAETAVSSSSDPKSRNEKPPEHPVFGNLYFDPNYDFNISLHNMYLQKINNVDIDEEDVHRLNDCVKTGNGRVFLDLVNKYSGPLTVQNFISMTLAHLKGMNQMVDRTYKKLLASIEEHNPYFYGSLKVRVILEVITMNLLFELEKRNMFEAAKYLLVKFSNWDSLITSRLFITDIRTGVSIVGRYLFIAKILVFSKPELTYEILACPNLHLLEEYQKWPYHPPCPIPEIFTGDLDARNAVLQNFLKTGFLLNTVAVTELYKMALKRRGGIWSFDVRPFIDPMIVELLNRRLIVPLKQIHSEINIFFNFMEKDTLRAFLIIMINHLSKADIFKVLEKCMAKNIYQKIMRGQMLQHTIEIKTNMLPAEIEVIILYYFYKLVEIKNLPPGSDPLRFEIKLPGESRPKFLTILNTNKSLMEVKETIKHFLKIRCSIDCETVLSNMVEVQKEELIKYLENPGRVRT